MKEFSDAINKTSDGGEETTRSVYATAVKDDSGLYVRFDGSEINTPATSMVEVGNGDRVLAMIKGHTAIITGNISFPSLRRKGDVYITLTSQGVVVGKLNKNNVAEGYYVLITNTDVEVIDAAGAIVAKFGTTAQIGKSSSVHAVTTNTGLQVLDGSNKVIARFEDTVQIGKNGKPHTNINSSRFEVYNANNELVGYFGDQAQIGKSDKAHLNLTSNGVSLANATKNLATFTGDLISLAQGLVQISSNLIKLGDNDRAQIDFCKEKAFIGYYDDGCYFGGGSATKDMSLSNYRAPYVASCVSVTDPSVSPPVYGSSIQLIKEDGTPISSVIADTTGVHVTVPSGKMLRVNGVEVLTVGQLFRSGSVTRTISSINAWTTGTYDLSVSVPDHYTLVGVVQFTTSLGNVMPISWSIVNSNTIRLTVMNVMPSGNSASTNITIWAAWLALRTSNSYSESSYKTWLRTKHFKT